MINYISTDNYNKKLNVRTVGPMIEGTFEYQDLKGMRSPSKLTIKYVDPSALGAVNINKKDQSVEINFRGSAEAIDFIDFCKAVVDGYNAFK